MWAFGENSRFDDVLHIGGSDLGRLDTPSLSRCSARFGRGTRLCALPAERAGKRLLVSSSPTWPAPLGTSAFWCQHCGDPFAGRGSRKWSKYGHGADGTAWAAVGVATLRRCVALPVGLLAASYAI